MKNLLKTVKEYMKILGFVFVAGAMFWALTLYIEFLVYSGEGGSAAVAIQIIGFMWLAWYLWQKLLKCSPVFSFARV